MKPKQNWFPEESQKSFDIAHKTFDSVICKHGQFSAKKDAQHIVNIELSCNIFNIF